MQHHRPRPAENLVIHQRDREILRRLAAGEEHRPRHRLVIQSRHRAAAENRRDIHRNRPARTRRPHQPDQRLPARLVRRVRRARETHHVVRDHHQRARIRPELRAARRIQQSHTEHPVLLECGILHDLHPHRLVRLAVRKHQQPVRPRVITARQRRPVHRRIIHRHHARAAVQPIHRHINETRALIDHKQVRAEPKIPRRRLVIDDR